MAARDDLKITQHRGCPHSTEDVHIPQRILRPNMPDVLGLRKLPVDASREQGQVVSLLAYKSLILLK